ncbi:MAG TPA: hypothetical protein VFA77_02120, partial [Candidatus Eisenbacteria bacterium]|nr:hypothetical protein [Candidatus Eisenbacteria bacterium]
DVTTGLLFVRLAAINPGLFNQPVSRLSSLHAMTPIEPASPPRKASWKRWIVAIAGVLVIAALVFFLQAPEPEHVSVTFAGTTSYNGRKTLVFKGTLPVVRWPPISEAS